MARVEAVEALASGSSQQELLEVRRFLDMAWWGAPIRRRPPSSPHNLPPILINALRPARGSNDGVETRAWKRGRVSGATHSCSQH